MNWTDEYINTLNVIIALLALMLSIAALCVSIMALNLKLGNKVIGYYSYMRSLESSTPFIYKIVLQNLKDKEVAIHNIYLKFGNNVYLDMLNKDDLHEMYIHVLPPLGTLTFKFGPAYLYTEQTNVADISKLFDGEKQAKIILSTNNGKIDVKPIKTRWSPVYKYFMNFGTMIVGASRYYTKDAVCYKGGFERNAIDYSSYGDKLLYLVTLRLEDKTEVDYPIYQNLDYKVLKFKKLNFNKEVLSSVKTLKEFLKKEKSKGNIQFETIVKIRNSHSLIERDIKRHQQHGSVLIEPEGWFEYYIKDKIKTIWWNFKEDYLQKYRKNNK